MVQPRSPTRLLWVFPLVAILLSFSLQNQRVSGASKSGVSPLDEMERFQFVYFGTQTNNIFLSKFYDFNGTLSTPVPITVGTTPTWIEYNHDYDILYTVNENAGKLQAFQVDPVTGLFSKELSTVSNFGDATCHSQLDKSGRWLGAVNYGSGSFYLHEINRTGGAIVEALLFPSLPESTHTNFFFQTMETMCLFQILVLIELCSIILTLLQTIRCVRTPWRLSFLLRQERALVTLRSRPRSIRLHTELMNWIPH
jgi:hypothetical protein